MNIVQLIFNLTKTKNLFIFNLMIHFDRFQLNCSIDVRQLFCISFLISFVFRFVFFSLCTFYLYTIRLTKSLFLISFLSLSHCKCITLFCLQYLFIHFIFFYDFNHLKLLCWSTKIDKRCNFENFEWFNQWFTCLILAIGNEVAGEKQNINNWIFTSFIFLPWLLTRANSLSLFEIGQKNKSANALRGARLLHCLINSKPMQIILCSGNLSKGCERSNLFDNSLIFVLLKCIGFCIYNLQSIFLGGNLTETNYLIELFVLST